MIELAAIPALSLLDRLRGGLLPGPIRPWFWALCMGAVIGWVLQLEPAGIALSAVLFKIGEAPGWGSPMAHVLDLDYSVPPERWQVGPLSYSPWLSLAVRGAIWGLPFVLLAPALMTILAVAMPLGAFLGKQHPPDRRWPAQEWYRGSLIGAFLVFGVHYGLV